MSIKRLHYFSGITISIFIAIHLFNHLWSLLGVSAHIELMDSLRTVYRNVVVEAILLFAISFQIFSGLKLFLKKRKNVSGFFEKLQIWSGLYLASFLVMHLGAIFTARYILELDTNFYFGAAGLNTFPLNLFFVPYYSLAIISFFGHISAVHYKKMKTNIFWLPPSQQAFTILGIGLLLALLIVYGLMNGFKGVDIPKDYQIILIK